MRQKWRSVECGEWRARKAKDATHISGAVSSGTGNEHWKGRRHMWGWGGGWRRVTFFFHLSSRCLWDIKWRCSPECKGLELKTGDWVRTVLFLSLFLLRVFPSCLCHTFCSCPRVLKTALVRTNIIEHSSYAQNFSNQLTYINTFNANNNPRIEVQWHLNVK